MTISDTTREGNQWNIGRALGWMNERFAALSDSPRLDAQLLLAHVLSCSRVALYTAIDKPLTLAEREALRGVVRRRLAGEPVAYILGTKHWHDMELAVDRRVLIPRPETETLFDLLSAWVAPTLDAEIELGRTPVVLDLCTGSGCLALAFARRFPQARVLALDISQDALEVAQANGQRYACSNITWADPVDVTRTGETLCSLMQTLELCEGSVVMVSNPPYVTSDEWQRLALDVRDYEPRIALEGGADGLAVARALVTLWQEIVRRAANDTNGSVPSKAFFLGMELGDGQPSSLIQEMAGDSVATRAKFMRGGESSSEGEAYPDSGFGVLSDLAGQMRFLFGHGGERARMRPAETVPAELTEPSEPA